MKESSAGSSSEREAARPSASRSRPGQRSFAGRKELLPKRYHEATELQANVAPDKQTFDLPGGPGYYSDSECCHEKESSDHAHEAFKLARHIEAFCQYQVATVTAADDPVRSSENECDYLAEPGPTCEQKKYIWGHMNVRCFLMNLDGTVDHLFEDEWREVRCPPSEKSGKKRR